MPLKISYKTTENEIRIKVLEQINIFNAAELEEELTNAIADHTKNFVLDFTELDYISSAGMRILILCAKELALYDRKFTCLLSASSKVKNIFYLAGLYSVLDVKEVE